MVPQRVLRPLFTLVFAALVVATWVFGRRPEAGGTAGVNPYGFTLRDVAREHGIDFTHQPAAFDPALAHIEAHISAVGAAVSICDANGDGRPDLFAVNSAAGSPNALFVQQPDGSFRDLAREAGLADSNVAGLRASMGTIWADCDGDGDQDCFLYAYGRSQLFRNEGALRFRDVTAEAGLDRRIYANTATWIDYDRDGYLDLYVAGYFREDLDLWKLADTKIMTESFEFADNGGHNYLYRNLGDGRFADVTAATGADSTRWTLAVAAADFDDDGWQDLYLANDYGVEELFLNRAGQRFERALGVGLEESSKSGMCVAVGDVLNDGALGVYVTNISKSGYLFQGNNLRLNRLAKEQRLQNVSEGLVADCGWAWGAQFGDLDDDGLLDLYVANGFRSASRTRDYWYAMGKIAMATGALAEDARHWPAMEDRSLSGYERSRVLLSRGRLRFVDAAEAVGATDLFDGRAVALGALWGGPALDVVVANQAGPLLVYRNEPAHRNHWLRLALVGQAPNTSAIGARATLHRNGRRQTQVVLAGSGFCAQNDLALHFGLGGDPSFERIVVRWPSGAEQELTGLSADSQHEVREP